MIKGVLTTYSRKCLYSLRWWMLTGSSSLEMSSALVGLIAQCWHSVCVCVCVCVCVWLMVSLLFPYGLLVCVCAHVHTCVCTCACVCVWLMVSLLFPYGLLVPCISYTRRSLSHVHCEWMHPLYFYWSNWSALLLVLLGTVRSTNVVLARGMVVHNAHSVLFWWVVCLALPLYAVYVTVGREQYMYLWR